MKHFDIHAETLIRSYRYHLDAENEEDAKAKFLELLNKKESFFSKIKITNHDTTAKR